MRRISRKVFVQRIIFICSLITATGNISIAQHLFLEECFKGGIIAVGKGGIGPINQSIKVPWSTGASIKKAYAITYRLDRPNPKTFYLDKTPLKWGYDSQINNELLDSERGNFFAVHAKDVTSAINLTDNAITIQMNGSDVSYPEHQLRGWWSIMIIVLFESNDIDEEVCLRVYAASQQQTQAQTYIIDNPKINTNKPASFSIYAERIGLLPNDESIIGINGFLLGEIGLGGIGGIDIGSVQGHFIYQNGLLTGLSDDTADEFVSGSDGLAIINELIEDEGEIEFHFSALSYPENVHRGNLHPAFFLAYTPDCDVLPDLADIPRKYSFCRGDTVQLLTTDAYDTFRWSKAAGLSDSTVANPMCYPESSGWYTVKMWNQDEPGCSQSLPIFVEVNDIPQPERLTVHPSICPEHTGIIQAVNPAGRATHRYRLNQGALQLDPEFAQLPSDTYTYQITSGASCTWDTTVHVGLNPLQEASFDPFPKTGYSPLEVMFSNTSTQATNYQWLIDGTPISESEHLFQNFPDSGSFEVSLIAYLFDESCADTATFVLRVAPGISVMLPNIISPNGDGRNDALVAQLQGLSTCRWSIFNRWGNEVHTGSAAAPFNTAGEGLERLALWSPDDEIPEGQYTIVVVAEGLAVEDFANQGLASQTKQFTFDVTLVR